MCVIPRANYSIFATLSSDIHAVWAFEHGSRLHERLRYTHGDVFETFPFPEGVLEGGIGDLAELGHQFFAARSEYMVMNSKGMTKFYNDFHDPGCDNEAILACRELQIKINDAVISAYKFNEIDLDIDFHEVGYLPPGKSTRFTMSDAARGQILAKLALLNKARHEAEVSEKAAQKPRKSKQSSGPDDAGDLFTRRERAE